MDKVYCTLENIRHFCELGKNQRTKITSCTQLPWEVSCANNTMYPLHSTFQPKAYDGGCDIRGPGSRGPAPAVAMICCIQAVWNSEAELRPRKTSAWAHVPVCHSGIRTVTLAAGHRSHTGWEMLLGCHSMKSCQSYPAKALCLARHDPKVTFCSIKWHNTGCWEGKKTAITHSQDLQLTSFHAVQPWMVFFLLLPFPFLLFCWRF